MNPIEEKIEREANFKKYGVMITNNELEGIGLLFIIIIFGLLLVMLLVLM